MNTFTLSTNKIVLAIACWAGAFLFLSMQGINNFEVLNIVGFLFLTIVPGLLTFITLKINKLRFAESLALMVGFSILELIFVALLTNTFLPFINIPRPLDQVPLFLSIFTMVTVLAVIAMIRAKELTIARNTHLIFDNARDAVLALIPAIFPVMAVFGAIRLNNGGSDIITLALLFGIAAYSAVLIYYHDRVGPNVMPVAFFFISASLLLMTSLRGWFTTGHDIQREYRVFEITKNNGLWSIASFRDAYNACMSITILPTIFFNMLKVPDPYVYKVFFQILFATVPTVIFCTIRKYVSSAIAFLATFYFVAFPTFFSDMPFLNRQEIAFLFLAMMIYIIFNERLSVSLRRALFMLFGIGMVLTHYSTTYSVVAILIFLAVANIILGWIGDRRKKFAVFAKSGVDALNAETPVKKPLIAAWMVLTLVLATFLWTNVLTNTASASIYQVISQTIAVIKSNTQEDTKSSDVSASLFSWGSKTPAQLLTDYKDNVVDPARAQALPGTYYNSTLYTQYPIVAVPNDTLPLTTLGTALNSTGANVTTLNYTFRQASAKILQILIAVGFLFLLFRITFTDAAIDTDFFLLAAGSLIFLASFIILPVFSLQYGVLRAFQQSLIFLGMFVVIGCMVLLQKFKVSWRIFIASAFVLIFFLSEAGFFTQILGGYDPQLHLNNDGLYYDIYYLHGSEIAGIDWLAGAVGGKNGGEYQSEVQSDRYTIAKFNSFNDINTLNDIYPGLVRRDSYILLGYGNVTKQQATISYSGTLFSYAYPIQFLQDNKNLVYNDGGINIYR